MTDVEHRSGADPFAGGAGDGTGEPQPVTDRDERGYADIRSYAALGDGRTVALVARDGRIDWLPLPDLDSVPPFAALLDADEGGYLALEPTVPYRITRRYLPLTAVLETTFHTADGVARITDSLNTGLAGRLPWCELARRIDGVSGTVEFRGTVAPGTLLRTASPWISDTVHGTVLRLDGVTMAVRTLHDDGVDVTPRRIVAHYRATPGSRHLLGLVSTNREPLHLPNPEDLDRGITLTIGNWEQWAESIHYDGPWQQTVVRSAIALKQLIYAPTGAVAAAATTSLPESLTTAKNWDYRFAWIRDAAFSLTALFQLGIREETHGAISWMLRVLRSQGHEISVLQALDGHLPDSEVTEFDVEGWRGHGPVVGGNRASGQLQLGVYGDLFNIVQLYVDNGNVLDDATGRLMTSIADQAADQWRRADAGIWELEDVRHYTTSKLGCWQALTKAVHLGEIGQIPGPIERWQFEADAIAGWIDDNCWSDELDAYEFYPGSGELDASILLHAISGFDRGDRMRRTIDALIRDLGDGPHLYRFTGAADEEASFVACSFWMVAALVHTDQRDRARALMDELVGCLNDVGLVSEMIDPADGSFLGNVPQALSHLAIINAALTIHSDNPSSVGGEAPTRRPDRNR
ncbi:glycoside hydrolase family 15 protein [Williamsia phyllosphaerae]|uniref:Glycosyl hydrolase n=1 Tax=Williamsia phyllosphaerae TaxID=885042 RepID=A0ABQ1UIF6_9NOCA|nr:glycoside hydrolase family 15 protein [Williamsia phyllosphaerae]GGF17483.1 glycosyl hydrolase [Williamsia phyllosphaerae]